MAKRDTRVKIDLPFDEAIKKILRAGPMPKRKPRKKVKSKK